jgi:hypothetical protein
MHILHVFSRPHPEMLCSKYKSNNESSVPLSESAAETADLNAKYTPFKYETYIFT